MVKKIFNVFVMYSAGFFIPMALTIVILISNHHNNFWSGYSPLYSIPNVFVFYVFYFLICLAFVAMRRFQVRGMNVLFSGLVSSLSLLVLIYQVSYLIGSFDLLYIGLVGVGAVLVLWLGTERGSSAPPEA